MASTSKDRADSIEGQNNTTYADEKDDTLLRKKLLSDFVSASLNQMKVFLRVRPFTANETNCEECLSLETDQSVLLKAPHQSATFRNNATNDSKMKQRFTFSRVFGPSVNQKAFFDGAILSTVSEFVNGNNCLVFAYGTTNSGKTYTVQGNAADPGVIPLAIDVIFKSVGDRLNNILHLRPLNSCHVEQMMPKQVREMGTIKESLLQGVDEFYTSWASQKSEESQSLFESSMKLEDVAELSIHESNNFRFRVWISFAEIYNENLYDLLDINLEKRPKLRLTLDRSGNNFIKGLKIVPVECPKEARQLLSLGRKNLHIASTKLNHTSSRSHCIYTIYIVRVVDTADPQQAMINSLSFCDLAGSERVVKTQNIGDRLKEAGKINTSLMVFGRCIEALRATQNSKERPVIPFRDSKLTQLFQFFFNGKGKASMIVNVSPNSILFDDTVNVLRVSATAKQVLSTDQMDKTLLNVTSASLRLTDMWTKQSQRWSSFSRGRELPGKMSIMTQHEDSVIAEEAEPNEADETLEEPPDVHDVIRMYIELEGKYNNLVDEYNLLEGKIRTEMVQEFQTHFVAMEKSCEAKIEEAREHVEEIMEKRLAILKNSIYGEHSETSQEEESSDSEDENSAEKEKLISTLDDVQIELLKAKEEKEKFVKQVEFLQLELDTRHKKEKEYLFQITQHLQNLNKAQIDLNLEKARSDELESKLKNSEELHSKVRLEADDLAKMGDVLFEKDAEIEQLKIKNEKAEKELEHLEYLRQNIEKLREEKKDQLAKALADIKKLEEANTKKDTEINVLKTQIIARECLDNSADFKHPSRRPTRRRKAKENSEPTENDSQCSLMSSQSDDSAINNNKDIEPLNSPLAVLEYIKQSSPVLAVRNAYENFMGTRQTKNKSDENPPSNAAEGGRRLRRKLHREDSYQQLECTPPKQVVKDPSSVHAIVTRQLRNKK